VKKTVFSIIILSFPWGFIKGQLTESDNIHKSFTVKGCYGFIADVKNRNHLLIHSHIIPFEISLSQSISAKYNWQVLLPGAEKGISFRYIDLKNPEYLGKVWAVTPFINAPFISGKVWKLSLNASIGMVYASRIYDRTGNYRNTIFGSHLAAAFGFGLESSFYLSRFLFLSAGIDFFHYSNGETTLPNDGMNVGNLFISSGYQFQNRVIPAGEEIPESGKKGHLSIIPVIGWKDLLPVKSRRYLNAALSAEYFYNLTKIQNIGCGIAFFYDGSIRQLNENDIETGESANHSYRQVTSGLYILHDFNLYPVIIHVQTGYYILDDRIEGRSRVFNRLGLRYYISKRYFVNITHKSHFFFKGDNLEWGIGYILK
jgi:hypothetical protein